MSCLRAGASRSLGSCGLPVMDVEIRIVNTEDGSRDCEPGEVGELWSKGPPNLNGYYKQPDVTAEKMTPDGFVKSGDLVYADEQGLHLLPRARGRHD